MAGSEPIAHLQRLVLEAVLGNRPLPGATRGVEMPDIAMLRREPSVLVADEHLADPAAVEALPLHARVVSQEELRGEVRARGDVSYLRFAAPESRDGKVRLVLELRIATREPGRPMLGLSGIQVEFEQAGGEWVVAGDPAIFAA